MRTTTHAEQLGADVLDDIIIEEQNINPRDCDHSANYLLPIRIETDPIGNTQRTINRCMCCYAEIPGEHELTAYTYMDTSRAN